MHSLTIQNFIFHSHCKEDVRIQEILEKSLITSRATPRMSSTAKLAPIAKRCTLVKQEDD